ncbi:MAG: hypothetical protein AAF363_13900 [Bacteroidota bacterium]
MKKHSIKHLSIYKGTKEPEEKFRKELSYQLIEKFGEGPYIEQDRVREAITYSFTYFCNEFVKICQNEASVRFYQFILSQHEQAIEAAFFANDRDYPEGINSEYVAIYRRILKWILEQACDIALHNNEKSDAEFLNRATNKLNELVFLGDMIFACANVYAEQDMIEDVAEIIFENGLFVIKHKHHYDYVIQDIQQSYGAHSFKHVVEEKGIENFQQAIEECFGLKYTFLTTVIQEIHNLNKDKGGQYCGFGWESLPLSVNSMFRADADQARILFKGLTLDRDNKLSLKDLACKPHTMFRYLYRPILIWNIEGADFAVVAMNGFSESIIQLTTNAIPWGKAPEEWLANDCFKDYVHSKEDEHDKWLDDDVEQRLKNGKLHFFRNVTSIKVERGVISLNKKDVGEIDFIIIEHDRKKIFVADCKHLQGRYDMITQKNDFSNFTNGKKPYNKQIENKIKWARENNENLNYHYEQEYGSNYPNITDYEIEGIFIINTPTFYMFNSEFRIYTVDVFVDVLKGNLNDPEKIIFVDEGENSKKFKIKYPYFKKPDYALLDLLGTAENEEIV